MPESPGVNIFTRPDLFGFLIPEHKRECLFGGAFPCNATCHTVRECHWAKNARQERTEADENSSRSTRGG